MSDRFGIHLNYFKINDDIPLTDEQKSMVEKHIDDCTRMCLKLCRYKFISREKIISEIYWTMVYCSKKWKPELGMAYTSYVTNTWKYLMKCFVTYKVWGHGTSQFAYQDNGHGQFESMDNLIKFRDADTRRDDTDEMIKAVKSIIKKHEWRKRIIYRLRHNESWPPCKIAKIFGVHSETVREFLRQLYKEAKWKLQNTSILTDK